MIEEDGVLPEGFQAHTDDLGILVFFECVWTNGGQNMPVCQRLVIPEIQCHPLIILLFDGKPETIDHH